MKPIIVLQRDCCVIAENYFLIKVFNPHYSVLDVYPAYTLLKLFKGANKKFSID